MFKPFKVNINLILCMDVKNARDNVHLKGGYERWVCGWGKLIHMGSLRNYLFDHMR